MDTGRGGNVFFAVEELVPHLLTCMLRVRIVIAQNKELMGDVMKEAFFSLAKATFAAGDFNRTVMENANGKAAVTVKAQTDNVAGVKLPVFEYADTGADCMCVCVRLGPSHSHAG